MIMSNYPVTVVSNQKAFCGYVKIITCYPHLPYRVNFIYSPTIKGYDRTKYTTIT